MYRYTTNRYILYIYERKKTQIYFHSGITPRISVYFPFLNIEILKCLTPRNGNIKPEGRSEGTVLPHDARSSHKYALPGWVFSLNGFFPWIWVGFPVWLLSDLYSVFA